MDNITSTPAQSPAPMTPAVAPTMVAAATSLASDSGAAPVVPAQPKPSHKRLYILLAVFAVMGGALAVIGAVKPALVTSTLAWVTNTPMHAASSESRVLVNGKWVITSNPKAVLSKAKKPTTSNVVKTSVEVVAPADAPAVEANEPVVPAEGSPASVIPATDGQATPTGAFDLGTAK